MKNLIVVIALTLISTSTFASRNDNSQTCPQYEKYSETNLMCVPMNESEKVEEKEKEKFADPRDFFTW